MNFLAAVVSNVATWLLEKLLAFVAAAVAKSRRQKKIEEDAPASVKPLKDAVTSEQIDAASDSALDHW